jgi:hypothetical protein
LRDDSLAKRDRNGFVAVSNVRTTTLDPSTSVTLFSPKAAPFNKLPPATTYAFQVGALGKLGYTDWSDSMTFVCA